MLKGHALRSAAHDVAEMIKPIEHSIDTTILLHANLIARVASGRLETGLEASTVHNALVRAANSLLTAVQGRTEFLAAHAEFASVRSDLNLPMAFGTPDGCPPSSATLRVVEECAA